jgi:hypothetical protein
MRILMQLARQIGVGIQAAVGLGGTIWLIVQRRSRANEGTADFGYREPRIWLRHPDLTG